MTGLLQRLMQPTAAPGWLAVELGEDSISLAHVVPEGGQPTVRFAEERPWDATDPKSLERVAREFGVKRYRCTTLLKPQEYNILLVEAPAVKPEELKSAVRWRIKDMLDYHVDDATIDVLDVPVPAGTTQRAHYMYTVAARNDTIRATLERFRAGGIPLAVIDIPDTAQRNVAVRLETEQRGVVALTFDRARRPDHGELQRRALPFAAPGPYRRAADRNGGRRARAAPRPRADRDPAFARPLRAHLPVFQSLARGDRAVRGRRRAEGAPCRQPLPSGRGSRARARSCACRPRRAAGTPPSRHAG